MQYRITDLDRQPIVTLKSFGNSWTIISNAMADIFDCSVDDIHSEEIPGSIEEEFLTVDGERKAILIREWGWGASL